MTRKKNKAVIRPWCWYCEREFEDEKVLMQHQKAKHFKCKMCPRRLNTAGGLAVHIQQVHKLEPENLPRIENAMPGRDGYEVEIFGMEGIPAPDVADYKRRKEIELGLNPGTISQPQSKRPRIENKIIPEAELRAQLQAHKALMGAASDAPPGPPEAIDASGSAVYGAPPQSYAAAPTPAVIAAAPPIPPPFIPPPGFAGPVRPFPPPIPGFPGPPPPGFPMPPGFLPPLPLAGPPFPPGGPPPGMRPPLPMPPIPTAPPANSNGTPAVPPVGSMNAPNFQPAALPPSTSPASEPRPPLTPQKPAPPNPNLKQENPELKKGQLLKYTDANYSPEENRAYTAKYFVPPDSKYTDDARGKKRARAEDFL